MTALLESFLWLIGTTIEIYFILVITNVCLYWGMHLGFIGQGGNSFQNFLKLLDTITEPVYAKIRQHIKPISGFDLSPYVLILTLSFLIHLIDKVCQSLI